MKLSIFFEALILSSAIINFGYAYYITAGIRNIAQIEYRKGKDNNAFFYDAGFTRGGKIDRTSIAMKFEHSQRIFKINPLFFVKKLRAWSLFILWGDGKVDFIDKAKDGWRMAASRLEGLKVSLITKYAQVGGSLEKHSMSFDKFALDGFPSLIQDLDANYWQFNFRLAVGLGI